VCPRVISPNRTVAPALACPPVATTNTPLAGHSEQIKNMNYKSTIAMLTAVLVGSTFAFADTAMPKGVPKVYPLKTCPVSGDKLGEHGKVVKVTAPDDM
jgi:hypothetical protein